MTNGVHLGDLVLVTHGPHAGQTGLIMSPARRVGRWSDDIGVDLLLGDRVVLMYLDWVIRLDEPEEG